MVEVLEVKMSLLTDKQVAKILGVSHSQIFNLRKRADFPASVPAPGRPGSPRWRAGDIDKYMAGNEKSEK
jgi:predicted DNA-binding transcriptional regulator AlpA